MEEGCSATDPLMMLSGDVRAPDASAHAQWVLHLRVFVAGGEQNDAVVIIALLCW